MQINYIQLHTDCWDLCYWPIHRCGKWAFPKLHGAVPKSQVHSTRVAHRAMHRQVPPGGSALPPAQTFSLVFDDEFQPRESWVQGRGPAMQASPTGVTTHCVTRQDELVTTEFPPCCRCFLAKRCSLDARRIICDASNAVISNLCSEGPLKVSTIVISNLYFWLCSWMEVPQITAHLWVLNRFISGWLGCTYPGCWEVRTWLLLR